MIPSFHDGLAEVQTLPALPGPRLNAKIIAKCNRVARPVLDAVAPHPTDSVVTYARLLRYNLGFLVALRETALKEHRLLGPPRFNLRFLHFCRILLAS